MKIKKLIRKIRNIRIGSSILVGTHNEVTRLNWLEATLKKIPPGSRILDAGAGELAQKKYCTHLNYVSQDFAKYDGIGNSAGLQTQNWDNSNLDIVSDITMIPEPDSSFDVIMCIEVFEHLPNPLLAIKEFSRLLRKGGTLIITAPFCSLTHFAPYHFASGFNRYFYERHLPDFGFTIQEILANGSYFEYIAQELRRLHDVTERYCNQRLKIWGKIKIAFVLRMLAKYSDRDNLSHELLCFGYNVKANKL